MKLKSIRSFHLAVCNFRGRHLFQSVQSARLLAKAAASASTSSTSCSNSFTSPKTSSSFREQSFVRSFFHKNFVKRSNYKAAKVYYVSSLEHRDRDCFSLQPRRMEMAQLLRYILIIDQERRLDSNSQSLLLNQNQSDAIIVVWLVKPHKKKLCDYKIAACDTLKHQLCHGFHMNTYNYSYILL